jgi:hypothetical protein
MIVKTAGSIAEPGVGRTELRVGGNTVERVAAEDEPKPTVRNARLRTPLPNRLDSV